MAPDRRTQRLTLYQSGPASIQEHRDVHLPAGASRQRLEDLPATFLPSSFTLFPIPGLRVRAQEHRVSQPDASLLLEPGGKVQVLRGDRREEAVVLASGSSGERSFRFADRVEVLSALDAARVVLPGLPKGLEARPGIDLHLEADGAGSRGLDLAYLCQGPAWGPDYTVTFDRGCTHVDLTAWARLVNPTEMTFDHVPVDLVAGSLPEQEEVLLACETPPPPPALMRSARYGRVMADCAFEGLASQPIGEHQLYHLPEPVTLPAHGQVQVPFLVARDIPARREYVLLAGLREDDDGEAEGRALAIQAELVFRNTASGGLGCLLPAGRARLFQPDAQGLRRYLGTTHLEGAPEGRELRLGLGTVLDLGARMRLTDHKVLPHDCPKGSLEERAYAVVLTNAREAAETVQVRCPVSGDWQVLAASQAWTREHAHRMDFRVVVPPKGSVTVTYRVKVRT